VQGHSEDVEAWLNRHHHNLEDLARDTQLGGDVIELISLLVLTGHGDEEVYVELAGRIVSSDGQRNPLEHAPDAIRTIRELATDMTHDQGGSNTDQGV